MEKQKKDIGIFCVTKYKEADTQRQVHLASFMKKKNFTLYVLNLSAKSVTYCPEPNCMWEMTPV